jgi:hypothetical protein
VLKYRVPQGSQPRPGWAPDPLMVGIRSPDGLVVGSCTSHPGVLGSIPKREEPGKTGVPVLKYLVPQGSQPRPGWAPDPLMVGIRSPDGLVVGSCTSHPGVLGSIPKREEPGKTGAPCIKVPGSSRVPAPSWVGSRSPDGWDQIPRWAGGWVLHQPPWSFGFDSQTRGTRENRRTLY